MKIKKNRPKYHFHDLGTPRVRKALGDIFMATLHKAEDPTRVLTTTSEQESPDPDASSTSSHHSPSLHSLRVSVALLATFHLDRHHVGADHLSIATTEVSSVVTGALAGADGCGRT